MEIILFWVAALAAADPSTPAQSEAQPAFVLQMKLVPKAVYGDVPSQLLVTAKGGPLGGMKLSLRATHGFRVEPSEVRWAPSENHTSFVVSADLRPLLMPPTTSGTVVASISRVDTGVERVVTNEFLDFDYQAAVSVWVYLLIGAMGVAIGYLLRMAIRALSETEPAQLLALGTVPPPAGLRAFVLEHYYWVDFGVTLGLGLLVLMSLMKDGRPPANAPYWYSTAIMGVGLGLLTNSDLLTRVK